MDSKTVGLAGLRGWRATVANASAGPVAKRTGMSEDQVKAVVGAIFLVLSIVYVAGAIGDLVRRHD